MCKYVAHMPHTFALLKQKKGGGIMEDDYEDYSENDYAYDDLTSPREIFYALTDGMCGDFEDWGGDIDAVSEYMGLD